MLNTKKSKNMLFGKACSLPNLVLNGKDIEWVHSWSYLGVTLKSHKSFNCCIDSKIKSFYRAANAILRIDGRSDEIVMLRLLESQCISILKYGVEVIYVADRDERRKLSCLQFGIPKSFWVPRLGNRIRTTTRIQTTDMGRVAWEAHSKLHEKRWNAAFIETCLVTLCFNVSFVSLPRILYVLHEFHVN